mgnify:CR=1 FL=1
MRDNNPFKPVLPKPVTDNDLATDPSADNFLASSDGVDDRLSQHATLDGMLSANARQNNDFGDIANVAARHQHHEPITPTFNAKPEEANNAVEHNHDEKANKEESKPSSNSNKADIFAVAAAAADNQTTPPKALDKPNKKAPVQKANGSEKQVTISLLTIVFGVLFIISTIAAVYFYMQNNKSQNDLADAKAKVSQLSDTASNDSAESDKATTNYDALQNRIQDLSKQVTDKDKTISDKQKTIDDQNGKITTLNKQVTDLQNKINSDKTVSDNMKSLVTTLCTNDQFKSSSACVSNGQSQSKNNSQSNQAVAPTTNTSTVQNTRP